MGYRDELIRRLQDSDQWDALTPERRREIEQLDDEEACRAMGMQDAFDSGFEICTDDEVDRFARAASQSNARDALGVFDGRLFVLEPGKKPRLSELGRALADFIATAKDHGFPTEADIAKQLPSVTLECLMLIAMLAETDQA
ncbi:MAG TPA: hypothetical protein VMV10_01400 [Pirellulales bacterium]|nr:hypothetical protein [Pirellulales bacterium]